jgi:hypothetical protein
MTLRITTALIICMVSVGCSDNRSPAPNDTKIPVPPFQIKIMLSDAAAKKLRDAGESIKGAVYFDGDGTRKDHEDTAPFRAVVLGVYNFETTGAGGVSVSNAVISEEAFHRLSDSNYYYTVNVFSGRRAFKNNVLDCGDAEGQISNAVKSPIEITCDLIEK